MANSISGDVQDTALQATKDNGLIVDFTLGPNQGAGVSRIGGISSDNFDFANSVSLGSNTSRR